LLPRFIKTISLCCSSYLRVSKLWLANIFSIFVLWTVWQLRKVNRHTRFYWYFITLHTQGGKLLYNAHTTHKYNWLLRPSMKFNYKYIDRANQSTFVTNGRVSKQKWKRSKNIWNLHHALCNLDYWSLDLWLSLCKYIPEILVYHCIARSQKVLATL